MSISVTGIPPATPRVRHQAREVVALMVFSAATSVTISLTLLLLMTFGHRG